MWHNSVSRSAGHCTGLSCFVFSLSNALLVQPCIILIAVNLQVQSSFDAVLNTANICSRQMPTWQSSGPLRNRPVTFGNHRYAQIRLSVCLLPACFYASRSPVTELGGVYWFHHCLGLVQNIFCVLFCEPFVTKLVFVGFLSLFRCRQDGMLPKACISCM